MPINRNALIRYQTLDKCLQNRYRQWTLEDLIEAVSEALYEYEGIEQGVSKRTIQADIQMMRSEKLGYNAPIVVIDKKYYTYEDPKYSITNIPLTDSDLNKLKEVAGILKQFKGFAHFKDLTGMVQRLEDKVYTAKNHQTSVIDFEKNENLKGLEYIAGIYEAILQKKTLKITYQSFRATQAQTFDFHAYLLKEYRNRWFVLGRRDLFQGDTLLALDRIGNIEFSESQYLDNQTIDLNNYFKNIVGVTIHGDQSTEKILLWVNLHSAPYVLTKPIHHSQQLVENLPDGIIISLEVQINFELEREILGFGETIRVIAPENLKRRIHYKILKMSELYQAD
ncbi:MAG: WYL domain-containing protein [Microscillaceae bacterium]|jgi:predicted DNA-binding transcriptional regulator YafY|nr:WYL domain-containing protein [Microscillaceae bacterium]